MKKNNILQLITGLGMGGAEKVVLDLSKYSNNEKFNMYVLAISKKDELLNEFLRNNISTTILGKNNSVKDFLPMVKELNTFVKEKNINVIHAHLVHSMIVACIVKIFNPNLKIIFTSHSLNVGSKLRELIIWFLKVFRNTDIIFSKDILNFFYKKNYKIIPNGIKVEKYNLNLKKNKKFTFISIGRLENMKNHISLINIANKLKDSFDFQILIVGEGSQRNYLESEINKFNLKSYIKLLGLRNDIPKLLNQSHCMLMPSLWEGLPIVILEAAASSIPIISTPVGSIPSLLNSNNSYISKLEKFEEKMTDVMKNYDNAILKSEKLFITINNKYSIENIVKMHELLYEQFNKSTKEDNEKNCNSN